MKNFTEELGINGHLTIIKKTTDGEEEVLFDDHNVIVSGMGVGLSYLFTGSGSQSILDYQIDRFQVGVSGPPAGGATSALYELSGPLTINTSSYDPGEGAPSGVSAIESQYGEGSNLVIEGPLDIIGPGGNLIGGNYFGLIPASKVTRISDSSVRYTIVLDEEAANNLVAPDGVTNAPLNEIGLFMKDPRGEATALLGVSPIMVAYRTFSDIYKTSDFSLIFRWTINF